MQCAVDSVHCINSIAMANHEMKYCPRCAAAFECKVGSILQCQCHGLNFTDPEKDYIRNTYPDCLCNNCLKVMKHEIRYLAIKEKMTNLLALTKSNEKGNGQDGDKV